MYNTVLGNGTGDFALEWHEISWEDYRIFTGGVLGGETNQRRMYFTDADGRLLERFIEQPSIVNRHELFASLNGQNESLDEYTDEMDGWDPALTKEEVKNGRNKDATGVGYDDDYDFPLNALEKQRRLLYAKKLKLKEANYKVTDYNKVLWKSYGSPNGNGIALVGAAMNIYPFSIFCITIEGDLAEFRVQGKESAVNVDLTIFFISDFFFLLFKRVALFFVHVFFFCL